MDNIKFYALFGLGASTVVLAFLLWMVYGWYSETKEELAIVQISREKAENNLKLVSSQLENERKIRLAAQASITDLKAVPDDDYETVLPPSISSVLTDFSNRMQQDN